MPWGTHIATHAELEPDLRLILIFVEFVLWKIAFLDKDPQCFNSPFNHFVIGCSYKLIKLHSWFLLQNHDTWNFINQKIVTDGLHHDQQLYLFGFLFLMILYYIVSKSYASESLTTLPSSFHKPENPKVQGFVFLLGHSLDSSWSIEHYPWEHPATGSGHFLSYIFKMLLF